MVSADPSSNAGVIEIMRKLHEYVPVVDGVPVPILGCGDGLSVERMINCQQMTNSAEAACERLDGLIPTPQEFHREMLLLQVHYIYFEHSCIHTNEKPLINNLECFLF